MVDVTYTPEQEEVLKAEGKIIVSASAGSGKTFVMIERMLKKILDGAEVERMLALTFTKKAAAQMREKIQKTLIKKLNDDSVSPEQKEHLKKQLIRLPMAQISTIHSFCSGLIRSHFFLVDVDGAFEVIASDDANGKSLKRQALEQVFDELYTAKDKDFLDLLSVYYSGKSDKKLRATLMDLYKDIRIHANYREDLLSGAPKSEADFEAIDRALCENAKIECSRIKAELEVDFDEYLKYLQEVGNVQTLQRLHEIMNCCNEVLKATSYFDICAIPSFEFTTKENVKRIKDDRVNEIAAALCAPVERLKRFNDTHLKAGWDRERERERFFACDEIARKLKKVLLRFDECYTNLKRENGKLDYNDLEHVALELLAQPIVVGEMRQKFDYVFVDEYQDINPVQEKIISLVGGENVFLVGDVKQAIYAFRGSKSIYFSQKQTEFEGVGKSLQLTSNFRSSTAILSAVNKVFSYAMNVNTCDIDYAKNPMTGGNSYDGNEGRVRLHLLKKPSVEEDDEEDVGVYSVMDEYEKKRRAVKTNELGKLVLNIINQELHSRFYDIERKEDKMRTIGYGDIAILVRKKSGVGQKLIEYLTEHGIPVVAEAKVNLFSFPEIRQLVDILYLIDNHEQDIPLCSALLSGMGGFNNAELAKIKARFSKRKGEPFRALVKLYAQCFEDNLSNKLKNFYALLERYSVLSQVLSAGELLERLMGETGIETHWLSRKSGANVLAHIRAFIMQGQDKNVHDFIDYLKSLEGDFPYVESGGENAVKVISMHASKGLEYPVVILPDLSFLCSRSEKEETYFSERYGIIPKYYDVERRTKHETVTRQLYEGELLTEKMKNELNVLYVAMTRAKYAMHLIVTKAHFDKINSIDAITFHANLLPMRALEEYLVDDFEERQEYSRVKALISGETEELMTAIENTMTATYPYQGSIDVPVKSSASEMLHGQEEYYALHKLVVEDEYDVTPNAERQNQVTLGGVDKTKIGTAYHAFLEHADFAATDGKAEFERLSKAGKLSVEDSVLIDGDKAREILSMRVFKRLQGATLYKEQQFMVLLPANVMFDGNSTDEVLFQGFIDLLAQTKDGWEIVDYKYSSRTAEGIKSHYAPQITLYKKAVAKIMGLDEKTIRATIVNIQSGEEIDMDNC